MSDKALYELLAKAQLHPNSLTHIERLIWWIHETNNENGGNNEILINAAAEFEQLQQSHEAQAFPFWTEEIEAE